MNVQKFDEQDLRYDLVAPFVQEFNDLRMKKLESMNRDIVSRKIGLCLLSSGLSNEEMFEYAFFSKVIESTETMFGRVIEQISYAFLIQEFEEVGDWTELLSKDGVIGWGDLSTTGATQPGIDVELRHGSRYYLINMKSSDSWGNDSQWRAFEADAERRASIIRKHGFSGSVIPLIGAAEGRSGTRCGGRVTMLSGADWWKFVSGESGTYEYLKQVLQNDGTKIDLSAKFQQLLCEKHSETKEAFVDVGACPKSHPHRARHITKRESIEKWIKANRPSDQAEV